MTFLLLIFKFVIMKKDTKFGVRYGVPYFIARVMAISIFFLLANTGNLLAVTESFCILIYLRMRLHWSKCFMSWKNNPVILSFIRAVK